MDVLKRDGIIKESFDRNKIFSAIMKAMKNGSGIVKSEIAQFVAYKIENELKEKNIEVVSISNIEDMVFQYLCDEGETITAKAYEAYRSVQEYKRHYTQLDKDIEGIVDGSNIDAIDENSNKNPYIASTQRDLIAGEYSRDYTRRNLMPENIMYAHDEGMLHFHDADYFLEHIHNCCLVNLEDMLQNGTVINKKLIEKPKSFQVACTVATQIVQQVANGQYGGQTISLSHLAPFVRISRDKWRRKIREDIENSPLKDKLSAEELNTYVNEVADKRLKEEIEAGVQTIQYQINTFSTSNGQAPFLSVFMYLNENPEYIKETAMLIEEVLRQRIQGLKNEQGVYITPSFPKLLYVTDDNNIYPDSEYYYLTELAAECVCKRMVPDMISAKVMREQYDGEVFPCMGCRSFLVPWKDENGKYKWYGRFNQGVVTINLVDVALSANKDINMFWSILDERLELCREALMLRHNRLLNTPPSTSPIHWQHGALARIKGDNYNDLLMGGYSTISLGYAGLYECVLALIGESSTTEKGKALALDIVKYMKKKCDDWRAESNIGFSLYGTPLESTTYKLARCLKRRFGIIKGITDHNYVTNSYHVNVREEISPYEKLEYEAEFQALSSGGCISYIETANLSHNKEAIIQIMQYMYDHIRYAEVNGKFDYCHVCGFTGEIKIDENNEWYCPNCGNRDHTKMNVARRTCGYIGDNFWNFGRTEEIKDRYVHVDNQLINDLENVEI